MRWKVKFYGRHADTQQMPYTSLVDLDGLAPWLLLRDCPSVDLAELSRAPNFGESCNGPLITINQTEVLIVLGRNLISPVAVRCSNCSILMCRFETPHICLLLCDDSYQHQHDCRQITQYFLSMPKRPWGYWVNELCNIKFKLFCKTT